MILGIGFNGLVISWFLLAFFKEAIEALLWKNCTFYRKQIENWGQWTVLIGMLLVWIIGWAVKPMTSDSNSISLTWFQKGTSGVRNMSKKYKDCGTKAQLLFICTRFFTDYSQCSLITHSWANKQS